MLLELSHFVINWETAQLKITFGQLLSFWCALIDPVRIGKTRHNEKKAKQKVKIKSKCINLAFKFALVRVQNWFFISFLPVVFHCDMLANLVWVKLQTKFTCMATPKHGFKFRQNSCMHCIFPLSIGQNFHMELKTHDVILLETNCTTWNLCFVVTQKVQCICMHSSHLISKNGCFWTFLWLEKLIQISHFLQDFCQKELKTFAAMLPSHIQWIQLEPHVATSFIIQLATKWHFLFFVTVILQLAQLCIFLMISQERSVWPLSTKSVPHKFCPHQFFLFCSKWDQS